MSVHHYPDHWIPRLVSLLEAPNDHERWRFFTAWGQAEGGTAQWNPLNSTLDLGSQWVLSNYNSTGVKNYRYAIVGVVATALTMNQRNPDGSLLFATLLGNIRDAELTAEQIVKLSEANIKTWGTNPATILACLAGIS
jgi:hypothetical protein